MLYKQKKSAPRNNREADTDMKFSNSYFTEELHKTFLIKQDPERS